MTLAWDHFHWCEHFKCFHAFSSSDHNHQKFHKVREIEVMNFEQLQGISRNNLAVL